MDVETQVEALLARRTFATPALRERTREALLKTLRPLAAIKSFDDDDAFENSPDEYRQDDGDGVTCTSIAEIEARQQEKKGLLRSRARELFSNTAISDAAIATEDTDINRKLKWGYTLLHFAASKGDEGECERLIGAGADIYARDNSGKMPYQKAERSGYTDLAKKLLPK
jgi:ankyrin repeat protein